MIGVNCITNKKVSRESFNPLVGCLKLKLDLQVNKMIVSMLHLKQQSNSVHNTMYATKHHSNNSTLFRNLSDLHTVLSNDKRWSGKSQMLSRFQIWGDLITASMYDEASIPIDSNIEF